MIEHPNTFNLMRPAQFDGVFNWDFLDGVFPRKIKPLVFDAVIEVNGYILIFETKTSNSTIPKGQLYTLESVIRGGFATVFVLVFDLPKGQNIKIIDNLISFDIWYLKRNQIVKEKMNATVDNVKKCALQWFQKREKMQRFKR